jgi:dTMP kinase
MTMRGRFLTLEGLDGAGKSTQLAFIREWFAQRGIDVQFTREPGGTPIGEQLRKLLLSIETEVSLDTETLLLFAVRNEHIVQVIEPALAAGRWVVCDRFTDATYAYQGGGRGVDPARIAALEQWVQRGLQPDLTLLFDLAPEVAAERMAKSRELDRFEREELDFHIRVRDAYLARARGEPARFAVFDASRSVAEVHQQLGARLERLLEQA